MTSRQEKFSGTMPVKDELRIEPESLEAALAERIENVALPLDVAQFRGGQSNPTYLITDADRKRFVLRRKPPGKLLKSAHSVDREFKVLKALAPTEVPVPRVYFLCEDPELIGSSFFVMEYVEGRIFWDAAMPGASRKDRGAVFDQMNKTLAALHLVDYEAVGLANYGKAGNYFARQISRWSRQYENDEAAGRIEAMDRLVEWLPENIPDDQATSIVHGDFRLDNVIFSADRPQLLAVLDWELSTLGHPLADFAYSCLPFRFPPQSFSGLLGLDLQDLGIPDEADFVNRYCERTGRSGLPNMDFYMAFNMFRLAAILHGILGRVKRGTASSDHAANQGAFAETLAELAWTEVEKVEARNREI
jgi:aminoglycoside phosphotransferase (APT) family kinase protein